LQLRIGVLVQAGVPLASPRSGEAPALLIRCHDCDLLQRIGPVPPDGSAKCARCSATLFAYKPHGFERAFVLYLTALLLLLIANAFPFLTLKVQGQVQSSHLISGAIDLYRQGMWEIAIAVLLFVVVFPLFKIVIGLVVVGPLTFGRTIPGSHAVYRMFDALHPWAMTEIFLLGVLVAYTKLIDFATVELGPSLIAFVGLILAMIAADSAVDPHDIWERLRRAPRVPAPDARERRELVGCHTCQLVCRPSASSSEKKAHCPRCGSPLHRRKPNSIDKTWALLITSALLYVPANVYPVMTLAALGRGEPSTIIGGVKELVAAKMWPLAAIVFVASILVPMLKMVFLGYLLISVRRRSHWRLKDRTLIYRIVEAVGRWSMVDVFVVSVLVALVQLGSIANITPNVGILAFASVVVLTMIAASVFDPRLMWDAAGANHER
jgi:paraquat-inducible protein A